MLLDKDRLHAIGLAARVVVGDGEPAARHAGAAQEGAGRRRGREDHGRGGVNLEVVAFWSLAVVLVGSALAVVLTKNLFHSVLWLALALTGTAGIFLLLDAEFLAAVQILLYAGGVMTVVVFAIVVTERLVGQRLAHTSRRVALGRRCGRGLCWPVSSARSAARFCRVPGPPWRPTSRRRIGVSVLTRYVLPFELLAVLLLVALIGASYFARPEDWTHGAPGLPDARRRRLLHRPVRRA